METFNYEIKLQTKANDVPHFVEHWYTALANIYGQPSKHFDGYVSMVLKDINNITIICYLIEGHEEHKKLETLKSRNKDWAGFRSLSIIDAIKIHARSLGYTVESTSIELLAHKNRSTTPM
jgi:hypothetical protein